MKVYCGDYANYKPPRRDRWIRLGVLALSLIFMSAATPAMIGYYWNGQNSRENLAFEEAVRLAQDERMPVDARKSAQFKAFMKAKIAIEAIQNSLGEGGLTQNSDILLGKLERILREGR